RTGVPPVPVGARASSFVGQYGRGRLTRPARTADTAQAHQQRSQQQEPRRCSPAATAARAAEPARAAGAPGAAGAERVVTTAGARVAAAFVVIGRPVASAGAGRRRKRRALVFLIAFDFVVLPGQREHVALTLEVAVDRVE